MIMNLSSTSLEFSSHCLKYASFRIEVEVER